MQLVSQSIQFTGTSSFRSIHRRRCASASTQLNRPPKQEDGPRETRAIPHKSSGQLTLVAGWPLDVSAVERSGGGEICDKNYSKSMRRRHHLNYELNGFLTTCAASAVEWSGFSPKESNWFELFSAPATGHGQNKPRYWFGISRIGIRKVNIDWHSTGEVQFSLKDRHLFHFREFQSVLGRLWQSRLIKLHFGDYLSKLE